MSINKYNPTTGELELLAGGTSTLYAEAPIGSIIPFGGTTAPDGFLLCQGQAVSRTTYAELFEVIGTSFGSGNGSTTFNLPDLRETVPVGSGTRGSGVTDHDTYTVGQFKDDQKQTHTHTISHTHTRGTMEITGNLTNYNKTNAASGYYNADGAFVHTGFKGSYAHSPVPSDDINVEGIDFIASRTWTGNTSEPSNANSGNDTGRTGATTHGKQLGVNYIIKATQVGAPADFAPVDIVESGNMKAVTSNAIAKITSHGLSTLTWNTTYVDLGTWTTGDVLEKCGIVQFTKIFTVKAGIPAGTIICSGLPRPAMAIEVPVAWDNNTARGGFFFNTNGDISVWADVTTDTNCRINLVYIKA